MLAAEALLRSLKSNGVDYLFANAGSDFAPIIEACANAGGDDIPESIMVAFENVAVAMAHGYYLASGTAQAAMVHVNVGLANAVMGLINAHSDDVPVIMMSGRTPLTEGNRPGARVSPIQYGQEQFDQTSMVRDVVKWNYELRYGDQAADLVSRAVAIANSEPKGAVYLSLPREPLCEDVPAPADIPTQVPASAPHPDWSEIADVALRLNAAKNPLIICSRGDTAGRTHTALTGLLDKYQASCAEVFVTRNVMASEHPTVIGRVLKNELPKADVVVVVDTPVAWIETQVQPDPDACIIHIGQDPLFSRLPVRGYKTDLAIAGDTATALNLLAEAVDARDISPETTALHSAYRTSVASARKDGATGVPTKEYVAGCISDILGDDGIVVNERGATALFYDLPEGNRFFGNAQSGGLGWALPAALGVQLADRDRLVVCTTGDGSYMFANPVACHQVAEAYDLPILTVVVNNQAWDAVRTSALAIFPDGAAAKANTMPMVPINNVPDFAMIARASRAHAVKVERAEDLPAALAEAVRIIREEKRQVLLDVTVRPDP